MSFAHLLMDASLWLIAVLWLIGFLARGPKYRKHNRRLNAPSSHCERTGSFEVHMGNRLTRRQAN